jgi:protein-S-isoprenylcysteine O-methyltransferase Ste14
MVAASSHWRIAMPRFLTLAFGVVSYAVFFASFLYLVGFLGNVAVPKSIDSGDAASLGGALLVDTALLLLFGVQHSVMARPRFKAWWTRIVPPAIERSVYVLASSVVLIATYLLWQPIPATVWSVANPIAANALTGLFFAGVGLVLYSTFLIDHFDLFGLRQVVLFFRNREYRDRHFKLPLLYRLIRHPLYVGWIITVWATPVMSVGHFLFALVMSGYILVAIPLEERDLANLHGETYRRWRDRTPAFVPRFGVRASHDATPPIAAKAN